MMLTSASALLQGPARDTVVALATRDGLDLAVDISIIVVGVALTLMGVAMARLMIRFDRTLKDVRTGFRQRLGPVSERAHAISDNVEFITRALRTDVERLNASVKALTDRLHQASDRMEERIEEFNALMEVVQGEAEDIFIDTAATVRGVREGARNIGRPRRPSAEAALAEPEMDAAALLEGEPHPAHLPGEEAGKTPAADAVDGTEEGAATPSSPR